jgi:Sulfite exporter TauE/SafE
LPQHLELLGGSLPFARKGILEKRRLPLCIILTLIGSAIGAMLMLRAPERALRLTIAIAMTGVAVFSLAKEDSGTAEREVSAMRKATGYGATFLLGIYGGFFSGGYVTMLTAVFRFALWSDVPAIRCDYQSGERVFFRDSDAYLCVARRSQLQTRCHSWRDNVLRRCGRRLRDLAY